MSQRRRHLNVHVHVPEKFVAAAQWTLEHLLRQSGFTVGFETHENPDIVYSDRSSIGNALQLEADIDAIGKMIDGKRFRSADFEWMETTHGRVPVLKPSGENESDLVVAAFFFLSGYDEHVTTARDRHGRYSYADSIHERLDCATIPVVDYLAAALGERLRHRGVDVARPDGWYVCPTVDVDYLRKWRPGIIYRELVAQPLWGTGGLGSRVGRLGKSLAQMLGRRGIYRRSLEHIASVVEAKGGVATFFVKTGAREPYDVDYSPRGYLQKQVHRLGEAGHEIGLHPSYWVVSNPGILEDEVGVFSHTFGHAPESARMHYLRWTDSTAQQLLRAGFQVDSTLGFADHIGFRRGTCHPFTLFDFNSWSAGELVEVPLLVMDSAVFNRIGMNADDAVRATLDIVERCQSVGGCAVLLWHNILLDEVSHPGWADHLERVLEAIDSSARITTIREVVKGLAGGHGARSA